MCEMSIRIAIVVEDIGHYIRTNRKNGGIHPLDTNVKNAQVTN